MTDKQELDNAVSEIRKGLVDTTPDVREAAYAIAQAFRAGMKISALVAGEVAEILLADLSELPAAVEPWPMRLARLLDDPDCSHYEVMRGGSSFPEREFRCLIEGKRCITGYGATAELAAIEALSQWNKRG